MDSIENILKISMEQIRGLADANTIIGTPIELYTGCTVIPISKVGMGLLSGGTDIPTQTPLRKAGSDITEYPFGGTTAAGVGLTPVSFVVIQGESVKILPVEYKSSTDRLIDAIVPIMDGIANKIKNCCE